MLHLSHIYERASERTYTFISKRKTCHLPNRNITRSSLHHARLTEPSVLSPKYEAL